MELKLLMDYRTLPEFDNYTDMQVRLFACQTKWDVIQANEKDEVNDSTMVKAASSLERRNWSNGLLSVIGSRRYFCCRQKSTSSENNGQSKTNRQTFT
jgi:hypothetical protein